MYWMLKLVKESEGLTPDEVQPFNTLLDWSTTKTNNFFVKFFFMSKKEEIGTRHFMKIQELGAIVGGLFKLVVTNCLFFSHIYGSFYLVLFYVTNLFGEIKKTDIEIKPTDLSANVNNYTAESVMVKAGVSIYRVKLNIFSYYFRCCQKNMEKTEAIKAFKAVEQYVNERLDVKYLIEHFERFDSLCQMVLSEDQKEALKN